MLGFTALYAAYFSPVLLTGRLLVGPDIALLYFPALYGSRSLWDPLLFGGFPRLADPQAQLWYPLAWPVSFSRLPELWNAYFLSAYVLAHRLGQVVDAANVRLATMSGQRYSLVHTGQRGAGETRGGLSLLVRDDWTGDTRDPATLSGGETFVVSLALALGLADVITDEAGGTDLDTLFVVQPLEPGHLVPARPAVRRPEVDQVAACGRQPVRSTLDPRQGPADRGKGTVRDVVPPPKELLTLVRVGLDRAGGVPVAPDEQPDQQGCEHADDGVPGAGGHASRVRALSRAAPRRP